MKRIQYTQEEIEHNFKLLNEGKENELTLPLGLLKSEKPKEYKRIITNLYKRTDEYRKNARKYHKVWYNKNKEKIKEENRKRHKAIRRLIDNHRQEFEELKQKYKNESSNIL